MARKKIDPVLEDIIEAAPVKPVKPEELRSTVRKDRPSKKDAANADKSKGQKREKTPAYPSEDDTQQETKPVRVVRKPRKRKHSALRKTVGCWSGGTRVKVIVVHDDGTCDVLVQGVHILHNIAQGDIVARRSAA